MSLLQVIDQIEDTISYNKQQNPPSIKVFVGDTINRDNEGEHQLKFNATIISGGLEWYISFPVDVSIELLEGREIVVNTINSDQIVIEDEHEEAVHENHLIAMEHVGITFEDIDKWATEYCVK